MVDPIPAPVAPIPAAMPPISPPPNSPPPVMPSPLAAQSGESDRPSPGIGTKAAAPIPPAVDLAKKAKADKAQADKEMAEKEKADREHGDQALGDMETHIRELLMKMSDEFSVEFTKLYSAYIDMPSEIQSHTLYRAMGEKVSSLEALLNTLNHTAASFPEPEIDEAEKDGVTSGAGPKESKSK